MDPTGSVGSKTRPFWLSRYLLISSRYQDIRVPGGIPAAWAFFLIARGRWLQAGFIEACSWLNIAGSYHLYWLLRNLRTASSV